MKIKLTNSALGSVQITDVGAVTTPKLTRQGITLEYDVEKTLADTAENTASLESGQIAAQIAAGNVTLVADSQSIIAADCASYTATNLQTAFVLPSGKTFDTTRPNLIHVYQQGLLLAKSGVYTVTNATTITLTTGATTGDKIQIMWFK